MENQKHVIDWLLESDPSIRWQVLKDIINASPIEVVVERDKLAFQGRCADILSEQVSNGTWNPEHRFPELVTLRTLYLLSEMGVDPESKPTKQAITRVQENVLWLMKITKEELPKDKDINWWHNPFFMGEIEPCINGRVVKIGAYFGLEMEPLVDRLLGEQMADGGWNCEQEVGSVRGSFHTTINVLEGLLEYEKMKGVRPDVTAARDRGHEYLLKRHLFKKLSTGQPIKNDQKGGGDWTQFSFPMGWRYDILRALDYLRKADVNPDQRLDEAIEIVKSKQDDTGKWMHGVVYQEEPVAEEGAIEGSPSYWNTLRAMRVLDWYSK